MTETSGDGSHMIHGKDATLWAGLQVSNFGHYQLWYVSTGSLSEGRSIYNSCSHLSTPFHSERSLFVFTVWRMIFFEHWPRRIEGGITALSREVLMLICLLIS